MRLFKITIINDMVATHSYYVKSMKEINEFVNAQFNDSPNMPQDTLSMTIEVVGQLIFDGKAWINNPEYFDNIK